MADTSEIHTLAAALGPKPYTTAAAGLGAVPRTSDSPPVSFSDTFQKQVVSQDPSVSGAPPADASVGPTATVTDATPQGTPGKSLPPGVAAIAGLRLAAVTPEGTVESVMAAQGVSPEVAVETRAGTTEPLAPASLTAVGHTALAADARALLHLRGLDEGADADANAIGPAAAIVSPLAVGMDTGTSSSRGAAIAMAPEPVRTALAAMAALSDEVGTHVAQGGSASSSTQVGTPSTDAVVAAAREPVLAGGSLQGNVTEPTVAPAVQPAQLLRLLPNDGQLDAIGTGDGANPRGAAHDLAAVFSVGPTGGAASEPQQGAGVAQASVRFPLGQAGWDQAVGERVLWLLSRNINTAEIRLNPPQLGPIEVRVAMNNDQASVTFVSHSAVVRDALEAAIPRLREMFDATGLNLADAGVSDQALSERRYATPEHAADAGHEGGPGSVASLGSDDAGDIPAHTTIANLRVGAVDLYA